MNEISLNHTFEYYLRNSAAKHPSMQAQDIVKLCFQAAFGAEHLLRGTDEAAAGIRLMEEFKQVPAGAGENLFERISSNYCRINLGAWKARHLPPEWLLRLFVLTAGQPHGSAGRFTDYLKEAETLICAGLLPVSSQQWHSFLGGYHPENALPVHHSEIYRTREHPAYRVVSTRYLWMLPVLEQLAALPRFADAHVIAVDGCCASGKTTCSLELADVLGAGLIHMDDFFLPLNLRTEKRLAAPGGNIHYERFIDEVLPNIASPAAFTYRRFDCQALDYTQDIPVRASAWRVAEGAYACHPLLGEYMDLRLFFHVGPAEQLKRIRQRDGEEALQNFIRRWIPMENSYFQAFQIRENADMVLQTYEISPAPHQESSSL
jgi:uridine kinase